MKRRRSFDHCGRPAEPESSGAACDLKDIPFGMQEVLFDPQTSGGLLMAVDAVDAEKCRENCWSRIPAAIVGKSQSRQEPKFM